LILKNNEISKAAVLRTRANNNGCGKSSVKDMGPWAGLMSFGSKI